ncbi:MAG: methylated-DNA--[protein]-cysteine S-methyltransferase [Saprospiraceae bacterium]|nr:methylated-DNA--[protein]-cysteine S-methyltransferase [Saprospiraceae bacterium]
MNDQKITSIETSNPAVIKMTELTTPLGIMYAGATEDGVCLLEFTNRIRLEQEIKGLKDALQGGIQNGRNVHLDQLEVELQEYFEGKRKVFSVPLHTPVLNLKNLSGRNCRKYLMDAHGLIKINHWQ